MTRAEVLNELTDYLGYEVSENFLSQCEIAYLEGRHGPAGFGGFATLGYFVPFEKVLCHSHNTHYGSWPCKDAIALGQFFRQPTEKGDEIRMCLFRTKRINHK